MELKFSNHLGYQRAQKTTERNIDEASDPSAKVISIAIVLWIFILGERESS